MIELYSEFRLSSGFVRLLVHCMCWTKRFCKFLFNLQLKGSKDEKHIC